MVWDSGAVDETGFSTQALSNPTQPLGCRLTDPTRAFYNLTIILIYVSVLWKTFWIEYFTNLIHQMQLELIFKSQYNLFLFTKESTRSR